MSKKAIITIYFLEENLTFRFEADRIKFNNGVGCEVVPSKSPVVGHVPAPPVFVDIHAEHDDINELWEWEKTHDA